MKHLSHHQSSQPVFSENKIVISDTPKFGFGLDVSAHTRIFIFEQKPKNFLIDFIDQKLEAGSLCVVPPTHLHFLSPSERCRFFCVDIHGSLFNNSDVQFLYSLKFLKQKVLNFSTEEMSLFNTLDKVWDTKFDEKYYFNYFKNLIAQNHIAQTTGRVTYGSIILISRFLEYLKTIDLKLDTCIVKGIAAYLDCSEKTLQRACLSSFGITTKEVLKYHILLKGIYMLSRHDITVSKVSADLGFASVNSFDKCIKRLTNKTPKDIRHHLFSLGF